MSAGALPRLRRLDAFPVEMEGTTFVCLRDPEGISEDAVALSPAAFFIASLLDGRNGAAEIRSGFARKFAGHLLGDGEIASLVRELDGRGLLETPTFRLRAARWRREYETMPIRPAAHAGLVYPAAKAELVEYLRRFRPDGTGAPRLITPGRTVVPRGLVAPHIDFGRGGAVYAAAHAAVPPGELPELVLVLGVAHAAPSCPFILSSKPFATPLGVVETDREAVAAVEAACGEWILEDEIVHRSEHSIELQLVWLQAFHPETAPRIVPVLCSAFERFSDSGSPLGDSRVAAGIEALRAVVRGRRSLVLASVDLAHVGPRFGDDVEITDRVKDAVREADRELLAHAWRGDAEGFWAAGNADGNARKVDALSAVYTLLHLLGPDVHGRQLGYGQAADPSGGVVSFAAGSFD